MKYEEGLNSSISRPTQFKLNRKQLVKAFGNAVSLTSRCAARIDILVCVTSIFRAP